MSNNTEFFTVGPVSLAFPSVFNKSAPRGTNAEPKYNTTVIIPADVYQNVVVPKIQQLVASVYTNGETENPKFSWPFTECKFKPDTYPGAPAGSVFGNLKTQFEIEVVDGQRQPIIDPGVIKDGATCHVSMNLYAYNKAGNIGIAAGLGPILYVGQGEVMNTSSGVSAANAFDGIQVDTSAAPAPTAAPATQTQTAPPPVPDNSAPAVGSIPGAPA